MTVVNQDHKTPTYFGILIVAAMLPQIMGFNGSTLDTVYKIVLITLILFLVNRNASFFIVSKYFAFYLFAKIICCCAVIIINDTSIRAELQSVIVSVLLLYLLYESAINVRNLQIENIEKFYRIIVYFMFAASLYNMIVHFNSLIHLTSLAVYNSENICSFFDNKNTFGVFLLFGVLAATILKILTNEVKWILFAGIFLVNELMSMCRTAIILSLLLIFISFFVNKEQRVKSIFLAIGIILAILLILHNNDSVSNYIFNNLFGNSNSVDVRNSYVENMLPLAKGAHLLFGYGESNASLLAGQYTGNQYYHNTYLKELISGGIVRLGIQISGIILSFFYGIKCRGYNKTIGNLCLLSTMVYLIYSNVESVSLFDSPVVGMMAVIFIISIPIMLYNSLVRMDTEKIQRD